MNYRIIAKTDGYTASRDTMFNGKCEVTLRSGLDLKKAQGILLDMFNEYNEKYCTNWGQAVMATRGKVFGANPTYTDGTRRFDYDGRIFEIEAEED